MALIEEYRQVGEQAWSWVLEHVRDDEGPWLPGSVEAGWEWAGPPADRDSLYAGVAGLAPVLGEIAETRSEPSLYDGLAGDATALRMLSPPAAPLALQRLEELSGPDGWATTFEVAGEAGGVSTTW